MLGIVRLKTLSEIKPPLNTGHLTIILFGKTTVSYILTEVVEGQKKGGWGDFLKKKMLLQGKKRGGGGGQIVPLFPPVPPVLSKI